MILCVRRQLRVIDQVSSREFVPFAELCRLPLDLLVIRLLFHLIIPFYEIHLFLLIVKWAL
ncbi:MAG: hypothetical protein C6Y20_20860 [Tagaea sp. CACIAM 22H2]|nr:hypothetical protein [Tagaea sp. CACIAM 22H2]